MAEFCRVYYSVSFARYPYLDSGRFLLFKRRISMEKFKYSLLVLFGACSYGVLSTIFKLGFINGFSAHQLLGGQYVFGWIGLLLLVLFASRHKVTKKQFFSLLTVGTTMSMTGIFYAISVEELPHRSLSSYFSNSHGLV